MSKHLRREGIQIAAFVDIAPKKIGRMVREVRIIAPDDLPSHLLIRDRLKKWSGKKEQISCVRRNLFPVF